MRDGARQAGRSASSAAHQQRQASFPGQPDEERAVDVTPLDDLLPPPPSRIDANEWIRRLLGQGDNARFG